MPVRLAAVLGRPTLGPIFASLVGRSSSSLFNEGFTISDCPGVRLANSPGLPSRPFLKSGQLVCNAGTSSPSRIEAFPHRDLCMLLDSRLTNGQTVFDVADYACSEGNGLWNGPASPSLFYCQKGRHGLSPCGHLIVAGCRLPGALLGPDHDLPRDRPRESRLDANTRLASLSHS